MRKKLFFELLGKAAICLSLFCFTGGSLYAQIGGGGGIIHVTGDPDAILATQDVDINEGNICYDRAAQTLYFFDPTGTTGVDQWNAVGVGSLTDTDTRLTNPRVTGTDLIFDIYDVISNTTSGTETVSILDIAPVQDVTGSGDITVTNPSTGVYQVAFSETTTTLTITADTLFYTDEDGTVNTITLPTSDGSDTQVTGNNDISVTGSGTTADPYVVDFTETTTTLSITADTLFYTDEDGTVNNIVLPTSDGSDTQVTGNNDIAVSGTGTTGDPYVVDFTEALTSLTITVDTLFYTDEDGTVNSVQLPSSDGSDTQVTGNNDISVSGTGTVADPYVVDFTEALTTLTITADTLFYTDEDGTVNSVTLPTSDGSDTQVTGNNDIGVTGSGTVADPYIIDFTEALTSLTITVDTLFYTDEDGTVNSVQLPSSDGSDTQVTGNNDISVSGTGTVADPYIVDFTEALTTLTITADTLFYTDEDGTTNNVVLPTSDGSDTQVTGNNDISVSGTGTTGDPYVVDFTEALTTLTITADTLFYTDEDGSVNSVTLPTSDGSDTQISNSNSITVSGTGTAADPYILQLDGAHTIGNAGAVPVTDGNGNLTWTDVITGATVLSTGAIQLSLTDGSTTILDLDSAPKVSDMSEVTTAISNLTVAGHPSGIVIADETNTFGLPATSQVGVIFFIKQ